jgi:hypothetical protein
MRISFIESNTPSGNVLATVTLAALLLTPLTFGQQPQTDTLADTQLSSAQLAERTVHRRAAEAVIWGMPAVNYELMVQEMLTKTKGQINQFIYWSRPADWKNQTLTPNPDAIYCMTFFNTKDVGPIVIEVPPAEGGSFAANIDDVWQAALEDAGPEGVDKGNGGKYLILPPGYKEQPPEGYIALPSETYGGFALFRSNLPGRTEADIAARGLTYTYGFIGIKHLGTAQFYLMAIKDKNGKNLNGGKTYRLTVPANAPVEEYWSATAYNRATHALIRDMPRASVASQSTEVRKNADGSVDVYLGPKAPEGKESNWIPTKAEGEFEVLFRLYRPQKPLFDKAWKLPDIEEVE